MGREAGVVETKRTIGGNESGMVIRSGGNGSEGKDWLDAHLLILQAPQAENCSRVVFGLESFWRRREVEEEEPSEGEPELCLMGIIVKKRETRETEERERKDERRGWAFRA